MLIPTTTPLQRYCSLIVLCLALGFNTSLSFAMDPQQAVDEFTRHPSLRHATAAVAVMDIDSAQIIASHDIDCAVTTASTIKTVTSAAALGLLGPSFRFETPVYLDGELRNHRFKGNIVVRGIGDPTLGSHHFLDWASLPQEIVMALLSMGIQRVEGAIICDDSYYPFPYYREDWDAGDLAWGYGAAVHALNYSDNLAQLTLDIDSLLHISTLQVTPSIPGLQVINRLAPSSTPAHSISLGLEYGTPALLLTGEASAGNYHYTFANPMPASMLADSITHVLQAHGIKLKINHKTYSKLKHPQRSLLLLHQSPPLPHIVRSLLDRSDNLFAHALLRAIAAHSSNGAAKDMLNSQLDDLGAQAIKQWLNQRGVDTAPLFMRDGSGLARAGKASPRFFVDFLTAMTRTTFDAIYLSDLMPTADSRVGKQLSATELAHDIVLKSGSMSDVQCYVGYYPAHRPRYAFAVLVNNYRCSRSQIQDLIGELLCNLFAHNR